MAANVVVALRRRGFHKGSGGTARHFDKALNYSGLFFYFDLWGTIWGDFKELF